MYLIQCNIIYVYYCIIVEAEEAVSEEVVLAVTTQTTEKVVEEDTTAVTLQTQGKNI